MDRGAWWATVHGVAKSWTRLSDFHLTGGDPESYVRLWLVHIVVIVVLVAQLCLTLCNPMDCSPPGSSIHEILQARVLLNYLMAHHVAPTTKSYMASTISRTKVQKLQNPFGVP